jgi:MFS family permease
MDNFGHRLSKPPSSGFSALLTFAAQPIIGHASDKIGRKWLMSLACFFTVLPIASMAIHDNLYAAALVFHPTDVRSP